MRKRSELDERVDAPYKPIDVAEWVGFHLAHQTSSMAFSIILPTVAIAGLT
ncbi:hypothetical protein [Nostoc sp. UHCC 0251]|uniref:hypothetical protein n=1 Tax=Nostoc sp. UHCC 0251 TaxID=3110240 RepID=UPI002B220534|nr:hypothetical protein [Nostoc sp. UHCC 0251]MEA5623521.1 hypothetical protein [Nostoc sp. UHCC 0251]